MKYDHMVKANGKYYMAGEEIEDAVVDKTPLPFSDDDITFEGKTEEKKYTKTDVMKMNKAELYEIAKNTGVDGVDEMSRAELAEYLLSVFGL